MVKVAKIVFGIVLWMVMISIVGITLYLEMAG